jgi:hypothetical protein
MEAIHPDDKTRASNHIHKIYQNMGNDTEIQVSSLYGIDQGQHSHRPCDEHPRRPYMIKPEQKTMQ